MENTSYSNVAVFLCLFLVGYHVLIAIYNIYIHPLSKFPGPRIWAGSRLPFMVNLWQGRLPYAVRELHEKYGNVVRTGPDELSFTHEAAWRDIYARRESSRPDQWQGKLLGLDAHTLISAPAPDHARFRKAISSAFSERSLRLQEPLISQHIDTLIEILHRETKHAEASGTPISLAEWINFTTFDIMGDLGWGASFDCLRNGTYHPWVLVVLWYKGLLLGVTMKLYPILGAIAALLTPRSAQQGVKTMVETSRTNVTERLKNPSQRPDIMSSIIAYNELEPQCSMSKDEMIAISSMIIVAGSDPLASVVAGALTYLMEHPECMKQLEYEIRSGFQSEKDINTDSTKRLRYLQAVILEALRLCTPVPDSMRRLSPKEGVTIADRYIPGGITVGITPYAAFRTGGIFTYPDEFLPERWLQSSSTCMREYPGFHPFGFGPRSCAAQALAWGEMRLLLARLIWNFDIRHSPNRMVRSWISQKIYWTWQRDAMQVSLQPSSVSGKL